MSPSYLFVFITLCAINGILGDIYMQNPRGNNDRLNENGDRTNDKRLFDSQNNARGGYCWGPELSYYEGSILSVEWTNQHSCGNDNSKCQLIMQYMCSDDSEGADETLIIRDGLTTTTIPTGADPSQGTNYYNYKDPTVGDGSTFRYGMNEPYSNYKMCRARARNGGLFTATQTLTNNGAASTRQNPGATQYGFECAEERDYYPYWHPSPWKDIAVLVDNKDDCDYYKKNSQNVLSKNYCNGTTTTQLAANNERDCITAAGTWVSVPSWGIGAPTCQLAPFNRDNHLGNGVDGFANSFNWTLPKGGDEDCINNGRCACVLRIRYNITVGEVDRSMDSRDSGVTNSPVQNDPTVEAAGNNFTLALDTAQTGRTFQDRSFMFRITPRPNGVDSDAKIYNLNVRGKRGNIVQTYPATEYDFVPTFLEVNKDDYIHFQWTGCDTNPTNNAGEGKTSTDRSNIVQIASMTSNYPMPESSLTDSNALFTDSAVRTRMAQIDQENCLTYTDLLKKNANSKTAVIQDTQNCMLLNAAPTPRFSGGLVKMSNVGTFNYMSTRNNNFSNRSQKASIKVTESHWPAWKTAVITVSGVVALTGVAAAGCFVYAKKNPHSKVADYMQKIPGMKGRI
jgi:hypothetical protein